MKNNLKEVKIIIRLTQEEKDELQRRSKALHISMSALVRMRTLS